VYIQGKPGNQEIIRLKNKTRTLRSLLSKNVAEDLKHLTEGDYRVSILS